MRNAGAVLLLLSFVFVAGNAQKSTEVFIPIGQSPGLSREGKTLVGVVTSIRSDSMIIISNETVPFVADSVRFSQNMKVYLDRSGIKQPSSIGTFEDIKVGDFVEVFGGCWLKIRKRK